MVLFNFRIKPDSRDSSVIQEKIMDRIIIEVPGIPGFGRIKNMMELPVEESFVKGLFS